MREDFINFPPEDEIEDEDNSKLTDTTASATEATGEKLEDEIEDEDNS